MERKPKFFFCSWFRGIPNTNFLVVQTVIHSFRRSSSSYLTPDVSRPPGAERTACPSASWLYRGRHKLYQVERIAVKSSKRWLRASVPGHNRIFLYSFKPGWQAHRLFIEWEEGVSNERYQACIANLLTLTASPEGMTQARALSLLGKGHRWSL